MFIRLVLLFSVIPLVELYVLLQVGGLIGPAATIALILLTGVAGAYLARVQGFDLLRRIQSELAAGQLPAEGLLDGVLVLTGALLLLTPGFCTDVLGFCLLIPTTRGWLKEPLRTWLRRRIKRGEITFRRY